MTYHARIGYHDHVLAVDNGPLVIGHEEQKFTYTFRNFFHPFVGELVSKLNTASLKGVMDAKWHEDELNQLFFNAVYNPSQTSLVKVFSFAKQIDVEEHGPYANYNWELFFHIPLTVAVHLSKT